MPSSLPQSPPPLITSSSSKPTSETDLTKIDDTEVKVRPDKTIPKMIKQRSFSSKTIYPTNSGVIAGRSIEPADSADLNSTSAPRMSNHSFCL